MFLKSITINQDIILDSNRESQKKFFKVKKKTVSVDDRRKPIITKFGSRGYEKKKIVQKTFIVHKKGFELEFKNDVTIIVGDNGCGKTSLVSYLKPVNFNDSSLSLASLMNNVSEDNLKNKMFKEWLDNNSRTLKFVNPPKHIIFEKEIHKKSIINSIGEGKITLSPHELRSIWDMSEFSNGETVLDLIHAISQISDSIIVLDEPETSLSLKSQKYLQKTFKQLIKQNNQLIIITHSPILMEISDEVYDFEKAEYVNTQQYIKNQLK